MATTHESPTLRGARRYPRLPGTWTADVQIGGFQPTRAVCVNVSRGGLAIEGGSALPLGTAVYVTLHLDAGDVVALGQVVYTDMDRDIAGLNFLSLECGSAQLLSAMIEEKARAERAPKVEKLERSFWDRLLHPEPTLEELTANVKMMNQMKRRDRRRDRFS